MYLSTLSPGQELLEQPLIISAEESVAYQRAVEDCTNVYREQSVVPPNAVAALALDAVMRAVRLPSGAVHTAQELEFVRPVRIGESLRCRAWVAQNGLRGGNRFLVLQFEVTRGQDATITGRSSIMVLEEGA